MGTKVACNVENVRRVADAIEGHAFKALGFNMRNWTGGNSDRSGHNCGTVACIAGWAAAVSTGKAPSRGDHTVSAKAEAFLGLEWVDADRLFIPNVLVDDEDDDAGATWDRISPDAAVEVLRHLADEGEIDWPRAIKLHPLVEEAQ